MNFEVLLSCMNRDEFSIIESSNLKNVNTLIINQCDSDEEIDLDEKHRIINTSTRGLSISRNIAIDNAIGDICLFCDDDEILISNLEEQITNAYEKITDADIIVFKISNKKKKLKEKIKKLSIFELLRVSSVQISFKRESIKGKIKFDYLLGAGTPSGSGEENKFLIECYRAGLNIYYMPIDILTLNDSESTWFSGFDKEYFYRRGYVTRYIYGLFFSVIYAMYFLVSKIEMYRRTTSFLNANYYMFKGIIDNCMKNESDYLNREGFKK